MILALAGARQSLDRRTNGTETSTLADAGSSPIWHAVEIMHCSPIRRVTTDTGSPMARDFAADLVDPIAREIVANVGTWVDREVKPVASEYEHADEYPEPLVKGMSEMGLFGIKIPEQYGGLDLSFECYAGVCMELARGWMSLAGIINTHVLVGYAISEYGTDAQKDKYLPQLVEPQIRCALSITEPDAGSDAQAIKTTARRDGDDYILNGQKMWVTNGHRAGVYLVMTKTDVTANPRHRGITAFLVDAGTPGFTAGKKFDKLGYKGVE